ncbi:MAG: CHRD domain-containing protein [Vicinamibacterales bacterium]
MRASSAQMSIVLVLLFLGLAAPSAQAQDTVTVMAILNGGDVAPAPILTGAWALAELTVDFGKGEITVSVDAFNLPTAITDAHVHIGSPGMVGPVLFDLPPANHLAGDLSLTGVVSAANLKTDASLGVRDLEDALESVIGLATYVDVHTEGHGDGEVRGWLTPVSAGDAVALALRREAVRMRHLRLQRR